MLRRGSADRGGVTISIFLGILVGCWALLSVVSGESARQKQEIDAAKAAAARKPPEDAPSEVS